MEVVQEDVSSLICSECEERFLTIPDFVIVNEERFLDMLCLFCGHQKRIKFISLISSQ